MEFQNGIDPKIIIDFFQFLYRNCGSGFLFIMSCLLDRSKGIFIDTRNRFKDVPDLILECNKKTSGYYDRFSTVLFNAPTRSYRTISWLPCLYLDVDYGISDREERIDRFKIPPSIRLRTSPHGWHFYWIFKTPVTKYNQVTVFTIQRKLAILLGGDLGCNGFSPITRMPGTFNDTYHPNHFVTYETTDYEYNLGDFDYLPGLPMLEYYKLWKEILRPYRTLY